MSADLVLQAATFCVPHVKYGPSSFRQRRTCSGGRTPNSPLAMAHRLERTSILSLLRLAIITACLSSVWAAPREPGAVSGSTASIQGAPDVSQERRGPDSKRAAAMVSILAIGSAALVGNRLFGGVRPSGPNGAFTIADHELLYQRSKPAKRKRFIKALTRELMDTEGAQFEVARCIAVGARYLSSPPCRC